MGGCVSSHKWCCIKDSKRKRRGGGGRRRNKRILSNKSNELDNSQITPHRQGSTEDDWFDSPSRFESDCEEDFASAQNDCLSPPGFEDASVSSVSSLRAANHENYDDNNPCPNSSDEPQKEGEFLTENTPLSSGSEVAKIGESQTPAVPSRRKKAGFILSFKWKADSTLLSNKTFLQRPIAGSQVPFCPLQKQVFDSWSLTEPGSFKVRGESFLRDKKKAFSSNCSVYYPFGVDVFLSQRKVDHIARFVKLPLTNITGKFPPILVVNVQIPLYSPSLFQSENDGEGMSIVLYFKLSENYSKEIAPHFLENLRKLIAGEVDEIKGSRVDATVPVRERLKILGRIANIDDLRLIAPERKLLHAYNGKPFLSRPQHEFYSGGNYFEIDLDMHRFSYISRRGFDSFQDRLKHCILDVGLTIQGNTAEELPEQILCCTRLNGIDHTKYQQLELGQ